MTTELLNFDAQNQSDLQINPMDTDTNLAAPADEILSPEVLQEVDERFEELVATIEDEVPEETRAELEEVHEDMKTGNADDSMGRKQRG